MFADVVDILDSVERRLPRSFDAGRSMFGVLYLRLCRVDVAFENFGQ